MKKTGILIAALLACSAAWGIRFYSVNKDIDSPVIQVYEKGEEVPIGEDFFDYASENMDGYTVTVLDAELLPVEDFLQKYHAEDQAENLGLFTDYLYTVRILVANRHNPYTGEKGVALQQYILHGTNYILSLEDTCYQIANPDMPGTSFSLREGTDKEITLPFDVMSATTGIQHIWEDPPKLLITQYPHQKMIDICVPGQSGNLDDFRNFFRKRIDVVSKWCYTNHTDTASEHFRKSGSYGRRNILTSEDWRILCTQLQIN